MNGVNLNSPDLKLVATSAQAPARAISSPQSEGRNASAQLAPTSGLAESARSVSSAEQASKAERLREAREGQAEQLDEAISQLNDYVQSVQRDLQFEVNNDLGQTVVRVVDQQTQQVVRQIPDEVAVRLAEKLQQDEPLTLFNIEV
ncbi:flagellar protein FlaG [Marinobacter qingdaonensis]|uniref:Flagellar protein FlaG n=1 Tax=Marinobacter qingdaonensis TaxID=3108486 RepID=A0ABU5P087_9GAMM|nr:flagellar protein FlaG [Marinobacter sp. ASW11-75]MEA1081470.1 flagellar protein FlaG [Marinobacter sp. ASW11-75]